MPFPLVADETADIQSLTTHEGPKEFMNGNFLIDTNFVECKKKERRVFMRLKLGLLVVESVALIRQSTHVDVVSKSKTRGSVGLSLSCL